MARKAKKRTEDNGAALGFEQQLWKAADLLRRLIFLKYVSDAFEEYHARLADVEGADPEDPDEYLAKSIFWVPPEARWSHLLANAKQPTIGSLIDDAMVAVERENVSLKGVLPKNYARPDLRNVRLGELIDLVGNIALTPLPSPTGRGAGGEGTGTGERGEGRVDVLGRVYEYFLSEFASAEGKKGGQFYTPRCVVRLLVEMLAPYRGRVFDPCCGSGGMFVQSEKFVEAHGGRVGDLSIFGQESNATTWRLAKMNLAIRGIEGNLGAENADSFHRDQHRDLKADFILANPPFNDSDWGGDRLRDDPRWKYGTPPTRNANFAWVQHFLHHLSPTGTAGFVLANGSMSSNQSGEGDIRKAIVEADLVDCMVALPGQLFYSTQIPACLWFLTRDKSPSPPSPLPVGEGCRGGGCRDRRGEVLFIDARKLGTMRDRTHRELTGDDLGRIARTYHAWRGDVHPSPDASRHPLPLGEGRGEGYADVLGFCKSATLDDIRSHGHILTPGRYVGAEEVEDDGEPFEEKMQRLVAQLHGQFEESAKLEQAIRENLGRLGYGE